MNVFWNKFTMTVPRSVILTVAIIFWISGSSVFSYENIKKRAASSAQCKRSTAGPYEEVILTFPKCMDTNKTREKCNPTSPYRTLDGSCNNLNNPNWGAAYTVMPHYLPLNYADNISTYRTAIQTNNTLVSVRQVCNEIHTDAGVPNNNLTDMLTIYGQFVAHDLTLIATNEGMECCDTPNASHCMPMFIAPDDHFYKQYNITCLPKGRAIPSCGTGETVVKQLVNQITSYFDMSTVYGSDTASVNDVREKGSAKLRSVDGGSMLPVNPNVTRNCLDPKNDPCFLMGDTTRGAENPAMTSTHVLMLKEHNRIAEALLVQNPTWDSDKIFETTRQIMIAENSNIIYEEYLPALLGKDVMKQYALKLPAEENGYTKYNDSVDVSVSAEFACAAFRLHNTVNSALKTSHGEEIPFKCQYNQPTLLKTNKTYAETIAQGLTMNPQQKFGPHMSTSVSGELFLVPPHNYGEDLCSINIIRGRDCGLPPYTEIRKWCGLSEVTSFDSLASVLQNKKTAAQYELLYQSVHDIDFWSAALSEPPVPGGAVGESMACIIVKTFQATLHGDRFFFTHENQTSSLPPSQLENIRNRTLASIMCDNFNSVTELQPNIFYLPETSAGGNNLIPCQDHPKLNLNLWK